MAQEPYCQAATVRKWIYEVLADILPELNGVEQLLKE
jgi:hypothetical protein